MEKELPPRWKQRLSNYANALCSLKSAVALSSKRELSDLEKQGLIKAFEFTHELAWNVMKDYAHFQGKSEVAGSRDATREAFQLHLITEAHTWMDMIASRNKSSHTYNEVTANEIYTKILMEYFPLFLDFKHKMEQKLN